MAKKDNQKKKKTFFKELVKKLPPMRDSKNPDVDGDGFIKIPGLSNVKATSISDVMPLWYDHKDP